jgi:phosphorylcholine metabolism protein LicD
MEAIPNHELASPIYDSPSNLLILMEIFEEFAHLCYLNGIPFWIDWGTALGAIRHANIIPWDIDCDTCLTKDNYEKLLQLFENHNNTIGNLICHADGYNDRHGCCWIQHKKYMHLGADIFGVDCVSYDADENSTKSLMSQVIIDAYPVTPATYDYSNDELYPLKLIPLVGNFVFTAHKSIDRMRLAYGGDAYMKYPENEYKQWLQWNSEKLFLLNCPFKTIPEISVLIDGFQLNCPFVVRNSMEFNVDIKRLKEVFIQEHKISSWYETKDEIFTEDISHNAKQILAQWENDTLTSNIIDSPCMHYEFLPKALVNRIDNLEQRVKHQALCYLLTNKNTLTKFHCDNGGGGWIYLKQGQKLWWFISPEDKIELDKNNYPLEKIRELSFTELVFLHDHYLWGKIHIVLQETNDFVYFPENWAHRVFTYDRAFGIGGFAK